MIIIIIIGGLVCRGLLETYSDLNVHTFITLSAPLAGQYGCKTKKNYITLDLFKQ